MSTSQKNFRKRNAIYDCLCQSRAHPSAEAIYTALKPKIPDLSLGTVYRNLNHFKAQGMAIGVATVNGMERFDGNVEPHVHFICNDCGAVIDLENMVVPHTLSAEAERSSGGAVTECQLCFSGKCRACKNKMEN